MASASTRSAVPARSRSSVELAPSSAIGTFHTLEDGDESASAGRARAAIAATPEDADDDGGG